VLAAVLLMGVKAAILFAAARGFGVPRAVAAEVALLLAQAGEFGFVAIGVAQAGALLSPRLAAGAVAVVGLSMLVTPLAALAARALAARLEAAEYGRNAPGPELAELNNHVVIGGFGRVGYLIAQALEGENVPYVALDANGERVARMRLEHQPVFFGDAGRLELLDKVGALRARAFVVTVNNAGAAERMVAAAPRSGPMRWCSRAPPTPRMLRG
jgi:CPA2 family monovalent cation:H+ antiporter-2